MTTRRLFLWLATWLLACGSVAWGESESESVGFRLLKDESYRADALDAYARDRCKLDWYLPNDGKGFPTLVWFHGGGLRNGEKTGSIAVGLGKRFAADGIAVASVNYRLSPRASYPAYIEDAAAAVAHVRKRVEALGGSAHLVFVSGHSAGGYLTAMLGTDADYLAAHGLDDQAVAGYLPVAGQMFTHSTVRGERGIAPTQPVIDRAAPAFHARPGAAPFLCLVGGEDLPARAEENRYFVAAMKAAGHSNIRYAEFEGRTHATIVSLTTEADDAVAAAVKAFIKKVSQGRTR